MKRLLKLDKLEEKKIQIKCRLCITRKGHTNAPQVYEQIVKSPCLPITEIFLISEKLYHFNRSQPKFGMDSVSVYIRFLIYDPNINNLFVI